MAKDVNKYLIPACLLIGTGVGLITEYVAPGAVIGLSVGFLLYFFFAKKK